MALHKPASLTQAIVRSIKAMRVIFGDDRVPAMVCWDRKWLMLAIKVDQQSHWQVTNQYKIRGIFFERRIHPQMGILKIRFLWLRVIK